MSKYKNVNWKEHVKFLIPSFLGILLFIYPIKSGDKVTIPVAMLSDWIQAWFGDYLPSIVLVITGISFVGSTAMLIGKKIRKERKTSSQKGNLITSLFVVTPFSLIFRAIAFVLCLFTYFEIGSKAIYSKATGGLVFYDLLPILFTIFFLAGFLLPLLLNFGLLEFSGTLLKKVMRPLFRLPGRSAIDAIASWLGDGSIGVLLTSKQYEEGHYTEREACVIGTSFSLVSITFCLVVINTVGMAHMFLPFYLAVTVACLVAALLLPKIPPLSKKKDCYYDGTKQKEETQEVVKDQKSLVYAYCQALHQVKDKKVINSVIKEGGNNVLSMWIGVIPIVMVIGTIALIIAEYTPVFELLGMPFRPILELLGIPEVAAVSKTLFAGFADMLLPSIMIANVTSEMARFIVAAVSVCQLIYLSEVGALIIASKIPLKVGDLFFIFIERTLISLPIVTLIAHLIF